MFDLDLIRDAVHLTVLAPDETVKNVYQHLTRDRSLDVKKCATKGCRKLAPMHCSHCHQTMCDEHTANPDDPWGRSRYCKSCVEAAHKG